MEQTTRTLSGELQDPWSSCSKCVLFFGSDLVRKDNIKGERENINDLLFCLDHGNANVLNKKRYCLRVEKTLKINLIEK